MSVFVLAVNTKRKMLFRWKCMGTAEARRLLNIIAKTDLNLQNLTVSSKMEDKILHQKHTYNKTINFTYEQNKYWYIDRRHYDI